MTLSLSATEDLWETHICFLMSCRLAGWDTQVLGHVPAGICPAKSQYGLKSNAKKQPKEEKVWIATLLNKIPFCIAVLWRTHKPTLDNSSQSYIHGKEDKVLPACLASCEVSAQSLYRGCNLNWTCRGRPWDTERQVQYLTVSPENTQHSQCTCWSFRLQLNTNTVMSVSGLITSSQFTGRDWNDYSQLPEN